MDRYSTRVLRAKHLGLYTSGLAPQRATEKKKAGESFAKDEGKRSSSIRSWVRKQADSTTFSEAVENAKELCSEFSAEKLFAEGLAKQLVVDGPTPPTRGFSFSKDGPSTQCSSPPENVADREERATERRASSSDFDTRKNRSALIPASEHQHSPWGSYRELGGDIESGRLGKKSRRASKSRVGREPSLESSADNLVKDLAERSLASIVAESSVKPAKEKPLSLVARNVLMNLKLVERGGDLECLSSWSGMVRDNDAIQVLENLDDGKRATRFFHWAEKQYNFKHTVFTYNAYLNTLVKTEDPGKAASVFKDMLKVDCFPDKYTYGIVIRGLCLSGDMHEAMKLARDMEVNRVGPSSLVANFLIAGLCRAGMVNEAFTYFANLDERCSADVISYNLLIHGLCKMNQVDKAVGLFTTMLGRDMKPSMITYNSVLYGLCKARRLKQAMELMSEMLDGSRGEDIAPDVFTYNTVIDGLCKANELVKARLVLRQMMKHGCPASVVTYNTLLDGLCRAGKVEEADEIFRHMVDKQVQPTVVTYTTIIHGHCKVREIDKANEYFLDMVSKNCVPNVFTYTALIRGHCDANRVDEALRLLRQMNAKGVDPNVITYTTLVSALCKSGKTDKACVLFKDMLNRKLFPPDAFAFTTLIHGLCRHNKFADAYVWFKKMVGIYQLFPDRALFRALADGLEIVGDREKMEDVCSVAESKGLLLTRLDPHDGQAPPPKYVRKGRPIPKVPNMLEQLKSGSQQGDLTNIESL